MFKITSLLDYVLASVFKVACFIDSLQDRLIHMIFRNTLLPTICNLPPHEDEATIRVGLLDYLGIRVNKTLKY